MRAVGILVLVYMEVTPPLAVGLARLLVAAEETRRAKKQVVEVERLVFFERAVVALPGERV